MQYSDPPCPHGGCCRAVELARARARGVAHASALDRAVAGLGPQPAVDIRYRTRYRQLVDDGDRVRRAREHAGLSQRELAARSRVPQPNIAAIESGRRRPQPRTLARLLLLLLDASRARPREVLDRHRADVRRIVAARGGSEPRIFGSTARGEDGVDSDLDLLVTFPPGTSAWTLTGLELDLEEALGVRVDVVPDSGTSPAVERARREAQPI